MAYPACRKLSGDRWSEIAPLIGDAERLAERADDLGLPFIAELAALERRMTGVAAVDIPEQVDGRTVNPSLVLMNLSWKNLPDVLSGNVPEKGDERLLLWKDRRGKVRVEPATDARLLALKIVLENIDSHDAAREGNVATVAVEEVLRFAASEGLVLLPPSLIRRGNGVSGAGRWPEEVVVADTFSLQWHLTNRCDLSCRHCYDRTDRHPITPTRGAEILPELKDFCRRRNVRGHVSFTGGNPFLHPEFDRLYRQAADLGLSAAILGNPVPRERLERLLEIATPNYFQVSLEGLEHHNDEIRGKGNFASVLAFLDILKERGIYSVVMLTLTRANLHQVLPLVEMLEGRASLFSFNRLATFGEGAALAMADPEEYRAFLGQYVDAAKKYEVVGRKDNLLNLVHRERGEDFFHGCTGFGCGAAFNFVSLLADGEVHACRKFPSPIGNILDTPLDEIYDSPRADRYRAGSKACTGCDLRAVCGGCMAVTAGAGLDPFNHRDPFCFHPRFGT